MSERLKSAIEFMKAAHRSIGQTRKDGVRPYEVHPLEVMERVSLVSRDEDVLIAALAHDIVEDVFPKNPEYSLARIKAEFGDVVASLVDELTDRYTKENYPELNRKARKQLERERYAGFTDNAKLIKLADIAANLSDNGTVLEADGKPEVGFNIMFIKEKALCLPYLVVDTRENILMREEATRILEVQKKKFDVR